MMQTWMQQLEKGITAQEEMMAKYMRLDMFESGNQLQINLIKKESKLKRLEAELKEALEKLDEIESRFKEFNHPKVAELLSQIDQLKLDQQDLYKTNATNAQRIVQLMDTNKLDTEKLALLKKEKDDLTKGLGSLKQKNEDLSGLVKEKDRVIEILKDELAAHQLELVQREEELKREKEKTRSLETDNKALVDRWMLKIEKDANKMNEANEIIETANLTKASSFVSNKVFSLFNTGRSATTESFTSPTKSPSAEFKSNTSILPTKLIRQFKGAHEDDINCISISPDGNTIATGGNDKKLVLYTASNGQPKSFLQGALKAIMFVSFSQTGEMILSTSNDNSIKVYNVESRMLKHTLTGHMQNVYSARFTGPTSIVSGSLDRTLKIWDLNRGYCTKNIFTLSSCYDVCPMNADGSIIASGHFDNNVRVWDSRSGNLIREITNLHFQQITSVQVSPDERLLLTTSKDNTLKIIDTRMFLSSVTMSSPGYRVAANWSKSCFSSDGKFVVSGSADGCVYVWKDGVLSSTLSKHGSSVVGCAWNPTGGSLLYSVADKDKTVIQWGDE